MGIPELTPAERYALSRARTAHPRLAAFAGTRPFVLDDFQEQACRALEDGQGVLVCAPTGAGKTVVGEFAVHLALATGGKCFYTTPIKALSNQKYTDLVTEHGTERVGLLTGDSSVNPHAPVVVMTTEVLRNMLYAGSPELAGLSAVVLDEIHYLADRFRGAVWEEVILHLPAPVQVVGLSATVSNAEEFGDWLGQVRGRTAVVVDEVRPVPLWQHMMVGRRIFDLFAGPDRPGEAPRIDPGLLRAIGEIDRFGERGPGRRDGYRVRYRPPARVDVLRRLDDDGLLPAITFIFSRAGCDAAVAQCVRAGLRLTSEDERAAIREVVDRRTTGLPEADLGVLGYWEWREALERGVAAHHAGLLPTFKETVEELFVAGLVKAVFATETLALGINMPARTVVLERLVKYNGEAHADLTAGEYTQLTGRAGRRGIDIEGHAVVVWSTEVDPRMVAGLASTRTYPLLSSFRPTYNMAVNLTAGLGEAEARHLLEQSFAQFQADRSVVGLARQVDRNAEVISTLSSEMTCDRGDVQGYLQLLADLSSVEKGHARAAAGRRRADIAHDLAALRRGDVIAVPAGRRAGLAVVLDPGLGTDGRAAPLVITAKRWAGRLSDADFRGPVPALGRIRLGRTTDHRSPRVRRDIASALASSGIRLPERGGRAETGPDSVEVVALRRAVRAHPVHTCPDRERHLQLGRRWQHLRAQNDALAHRVATARGSLGETLLRILALLRERGYLDGDRLTPAGATLARIWSESDLVVAECLRHRVWQALEAPDLAAVVSTLVYESRGDATPSPRRLSGPAGAAIEATVAVWSDVSAAEADHGVSSTRRPDTGFAGAVRAWAAGSSLADALSVAATGGEELSAGDFVRWCRQTVDLLDQVAVVADADLARRARSAAAGVRRGVVTLGTA